MDNKYVGNDLCVVPSELWQKSYYEHIIRNEDDYIETTQYILENPGRWVDKIKNINGGK